MNYTLGCRIRKIRIAKGITLDQLSVATGISPDKLLFIESGGYNISLDLLYNLADALNVTVSDFTCVLDQNESDFSLYNNSTGYILHMLDLFYANKHLYQKFIAYSCES